jgi:hypothetical protein
MRAKYMHIKNLLDDDHKTTLETSVKDWSGIALVAVIVVLGLVYIHRNWPSSAARTVDHEELRRERLRKFE